MIIKGISPILTSEIISSMQDSPDNMFFYSLMILIFICIITTLSQFIDNHLMMNNLTSGHFTKKVLVTITIKKQLLLTPPLSKNYESGQMLSVRDATDKMINLCWNFTEWIMQPFWFTYISIRLLSLIGPIYFIGLLMMIMVYNIDKYFYDLLSDQKSEVR